VDQSKHITYSELDKKSDKLARYLRRNGIQSGDVVGVCLSLCSEFIISMLAVLKAGAVYFPLDPAHHEDHRQYMVKEAKPSAILIESRFESLFQKTRLIKIDSKIFDEASDLENDDILDPVISPDDLAYLIYTSGSTGKPKGILVTHRSLPNIALAHRDYYPPDMRMLLSGGVCFDASLLVIFHALANNSPLYLFDYNPQDGVDSLFYFLTNYSINFMISIPSQYLKLLQKELPLPHLKCVSLTGENLPKNLCSLHAQLAPNALLYNEYGPTECAIGTTIAGIYNPQDRIVHRITVGSPLANTQVYILDNDLNVLPQGSKGEICISGVGLAKGYLGKKKLTIQKFCHLTTPEGDRIRIYRTGDMGCILPNYDLEFLGRFEQEVQVSGRSINLGEIEHKISHLPDIQGSAVLIEKNDRGETQLVVYFTSLKKTARLFLLRYLRNLFGKCFPFTITQIAKFPQSANGKIDRHALLDRHA
jgi:amino acid adenylation domain